MKERSILLPQIMDDLPMGYAYHKMVFNRDGEPEDYIFLDVNKTFEELTGLKGQEILGERITHVLPGIREEFDWVDYYGQVAIHGEEREFEQFSTPLKRWYSVKVFSPDPGYFITCFWDITSEKLSLQEYEAFLQSVNDIVLELNEDYIFQNCWYHEKEKLFLPKGELLGKAYYEVFPEKLVEMIKENLEKARESRERVFVEYQSPYPEDTRWFMASFFCWTDRRQRKRYIVSIRETTEEKEKKKAMGILLQAADSLISHPLGLLNVSLYEFLAETIHSISGAYATALLQYEPKQEALLCRSLVTEDPALEDVLKEIGLSPKSILLEGEPVKERESTKVLSEYTLSYLLKYEKSPKELDILEKDFLIKRIYVVDNIAPTSNQSHFLLFMQEEGEIKHEALIRLFRHIVREYLERINTEKRLNESQKRYHEVVESQKDMICRFLPDTTLTFVNRAYSRMFHKKQEDLMGRRFLELIPSDEHEEVLSQIQRLSKKNPTNTYRHAVTLSDGSIGWQEWTDQAFFDSQGAITEIQSVGRDITELKRSRDEALRASKAKSEFLTKISHELRTPLHAVLSYGDLGLEDSQEDELGQIEEYFSRIIMSGKHLLYLIDDLLDLTKMESGLLGYRLEKEDLYQLIHKSRKEVEPILEKKGIFLVIGRPDFLAYAKVDKNKILQVIRNLIENGVKFSPRGSTIYISFSRSLGPDKSICVHVKDEGTGIPHEDLATIFDKFRQSNQAINQSGGLGLGLTICQEIIRGHGGEIYAENNPEKGATFSFSLPSID